MSTSSRAARELRDVAVGAAAALVIFVAVPGVLVLLVGRPVPAHWTASAVVSWRGLFDVLTLVAWGAWASCAWTVVRSVAARVRARDTSRGTRVFDQLALRIALAVMTIAPIGLGVSATASAAPVPAAVTTVAQGNAPASTSGTERARGRVERTSGEHRVELGDTLASIATTWYEEPGPWDAIAAANLGRVMGGGQRFVDPSSISPGWVLRIPELDAPRRHAPIPPEAQAPAAVPILPSPLPELAILGVGALVAGLLARRSRRARRLRSFVREEGSLCPAPSTRSAALLTAAAPFEDLPVLRWIELASRMLTIAAAQQISRSTPLPRVIWMRAGHHGVEVRFERETPEPPSPWLGCDPSTWRLPASIDIDSVAPAASGYAPWCPVMVPVGDDDIGSVVIPLEIGGCVSVLGPVSDSLLRAMQLGAQSWTWHEMVTVTTRPDQAANASSTAGIRTELSTDPAVLFVGNPGHLSPPVRQNCRVLTAAVVPGADVTVLVDGRGATIHPFAMAVRPHLLDGGWHQVLCELDPTAPLPALTHDDAKVDLPEKPARGTPSPLVHRDGSATVQVTSRPSTRVRAHATQSGRPPAIVEVQLLGPVPLVAGLRQELPVNRARRAIELLSYMAAHSPDPVTGDRLRTRVLGSPDADAAAKTLFNTVGAVRRALGPGPDGNPLLPPASRSGHYSLSPLVSLDARRISELLTEGIASAGAGSGSGAGAGSGSGAGADAGADAGAESQRLLCDALAHITGEPLTGVLTGYGWWRAEGHERRLGDLVVDGACSLVRQALVSGQVDLARWAVEQARRMESYSEVLTRAAMRVAAASGDAPRLHTEWKDCQQAVDDLDPGGSPSEATERLYAHLRAQLASRRTAVATLTV